MQHYLHLSIVEREEIRSYLDQRKSIRYIARKLSRSPSTIAREVHRNTNRSKYFAFSAQRLCNERKCIPRKQRRLVPRTVLWDLVMEKLSLRWSPDQIAVHLKETYPLDMTKHISHETIYQAIYVLPRGTLRAELIDCLRRNQRYRRKRRYLRKEKRGQIPDMVSIHDRPKEIESRKIPGHWEGDLIIGKSKTSAIGTLVERTSRKVLICKLTGRTSADVIAGFERRLNELPAVLRLTLT